MARHMRKQNNMKHGSIELVLLLLLQSGKKYGYQLAQELNEFSDGNYELKETTMYPTLYRLNENGYLDSEQIKVGVRRTRVYYFITDNGRQRLQELLDEYQTLTRAIENIIIRTSEG
jgi:Predicted transcriptional regulators